jgi:hypothetical protein
VTSFISFEINSVSDMASFRNIAIFLGALLPAVLAAPAPRAPEVIPGKYIITLKDNVATDVHLSWVSDVHARSLSKRDTSGVEETYDIGKWHAYAGEFDEATIDEIRSSPEVSNGSLPHFGVPVTRETHADNSFRLPLSSPTTFSTSGSSKASRSKTVL